MKDKDNAVKADAQKAATEEGVKANDSTAPENLSDIDLIQALEEKEAELTKVRSEKENYRKGLLKAKGKAVDNDTEEETTEDIIRRIAREETLSERERIINKEKDDIYKKALKENKELKLALKNKGTISSTNTGASSGQSKESVKDNFFTDDQLANLKKKGLDPEKVKQNLLKLKARQL